MNLQFWKRKRKPVNTLDFGAISLHVPGYDFADPANGVKEVRAFVGDYPMGVWKPPASNQETRLEKDEG